jgi:hypothetical protein
LTFHVEPIHANAYVRRSSHRILVLPGEDKPHSTSRPARRLGPWIVYPALAALTLAATLAACQKQTAQGVAGTAAADPSVYLSPPTVTGAARDGAGGVTLSGRAPAETEVRLRDPGGGAFSATANDDGNWSIQLPPADPPRMFALEGEVSGRVLHGEGALLTLPAPGPAAMLARTGYGALPIGVGPGPLAIDAIDYDGGGGGSVSGVTAANATVRLVLDGQPVGMGQADRQGRFAVLDLSARTPFAPGAHVVRIEGRTGAVQGRVVVSPPDPLGDAVFHASRQDGGWRIDWRTPGGGVQTLLTFAPSVGAAP